MRRILEKTLGKTFMSIITKETYEKRIKSVVITEEQIKEKIVEVGKTINSWYDGNPILLVSVLNGAFVFMADVARQINVPCEIAFMKAESYSGTNSTGTVNITLDLKQDLTKYNVVILEDIIDTGRTLKEIVEMLKQRNPLSLKVITLLDKPSRRKVDFTADISLFTIPDLFVIGYGLDCDEDFRNLPYVGEFNTEI